MVSRPFNLVFQSYQLDGKLVMLVSNDHCLFLLCYSMNYTGWRPVVAAYQWWPFAFCRAIMYLLLLRIGNFVKGNKRNLHKKEWLKAKKR